MSWFSKLFNIGPKIKFGEYDIVSDSTNKIVFDIDTKVIYANGFPFVCHNNDDTEDMLLIDHSTRLDDAESMIDGLNEQISKMQSQIDANNVMIVEKNNRITELTNQLNAMQDLLDKLNVILINNNKRLDVIDEQVLANTIKNEEQDKMLMCD